MPRERSPRSPGDKANELVIVQRLGVAAAVMLLAVACSGGGEEATPEPTATAVALDPTPTAEPVDEPTATAVPEPTPTATPEPSDPEAATEAWSAFWQAVAVPDDDAAGLAAALEFGTPDAIDRVRSFPWGSTDRDVETFPVVEADADGSFEVNDCMFFTPGFGGGGGAIWWEGTVELVDGAWTVTAADRVANFDPCVPAELAQAAIAGYEAYLDAVPVFWDPPDPDSPLVDDTMTGSHFDVTLDLVRQAVEEGWAVRGRPQSHPEVTSVFGPDSLILLDCYLTDPGRGAYDLATGERLDDVIAPIAPGRIDKAAVEMKREEGTWKVAGVNTVLNDTCEFAPTAAGLPVV